MKIIYADAHGPVLGKDQPSPNLSLLYLAGYISHRQPSVQQLYISQKPSIEYHLEAIRKLEADIYAISFTSYSASVAFNMIRRIKQAHPDVLVVIGGAHVITHAEQSLRESGADICVIGEGENTFFDIVRNHDNLLKALPDINGVGYLKNDLYLSTPSRALIEDIDSIPFPARDLIDQRDFTGVSYSKRSPNTEVVITRGCPLRCVFCANPVFRIEGAPIFRARTAQNIAEEVNQLYQEGYREIYFHSDELNVRLGWSIELCKALAALGHKDLYFQCNMRVVPMSEELAYWMKQANFWLVRVGIESTSQRVLKGVKKRMSLEKTERACELWTRHGIKVLGFLMMYNYWEQDGRLEHETSEEVKNTISFGYHLWRKKKLHYTSWSVAAPLPGAELYDISVKYNIIDNSYLPGGAWKPYEHLPITRREFYGCYRRARLQTAILAISSGNIEWKNWRSILSKLKVLLTGPES